MYFTKGFGRSYCIALDKKGRLVLPLEIREALGIETNGRIVISVSDSRGDRVLLNLSKASESDLANSIPFSKNGKYLQEKRGETNGD